MNLNKALIYGNITKDPELKTLPSGSVVTNFSVATNRKWKDKNGEQKEDVEFHNVVCFGKTAENVSQYMHKGSGIFIEGRIQTRSWQDQKSGEKRYRAEIIAENVQFGPRQGAGAGGDYPQSTGQSRASDSDKPDMTPAENLPVIQEDEPEIEVKDIPF